MNLYVQDNLTGEKLQINRAVVKNGTITNNVSVLIDPQSEKGGWTTHGIKQIQLTERINSGESHLWQRKRRYEVKVKEE